MSRICVFIDNSSLFRALSELGVDDRFDYRRLSQWLVRDRQPDVIRLYIGEVRTDTQRRYRFYQALEKAGIQVVRIFQPRSRASNAAFDAVNTAKIEVEITWDICEVVERPDIDSIVLVSGSQELARIVTKVVERGVNVEVVFFEEACSPVLRSRATSFRQLRVEGLRMGEARRSATSKPRTERCVCD
jgi:uncharacterized LabA/DUF88 family protein